MSKVPCTFYLSSAVVQALRLYVGDQRRRSEIVNSLLTQFLIVQAPDADECDVETKLEQKKKESLQVEEEVAALAATLAQIREEKHREQKARLDVALQEQKEAVRRTQALRQSGISRLIE